MKHSKTSNLGKLCILKALNILIKTYHGGVPEEKDFMPFIIVSIIHGGYFIQGNNGNTYKVKSKDIYIP